MKTFNPLNVSSKFAICGLPIRVDTYKTCSFNCTYCFSNHRKVMEFEKNLQVANLKALECKLDALFSKDTRNPTSLLDQLILQNLTWHCGGMSDPFQPIESKLQITKQLTSICNKYNRTILFSTKSDNIYDAPIDPELHSFQLSVTNVYNNTDLEPNVPDINTRYNLFKQLKQSGFKVGIRIQPFIPGITSLDIVKLFHDADHFTIEGLKLVPQNKAHKDYLLQILNLNRADFTQMGLLNLKPDVRLALYQPFLDYFKEHNISYSIADNDLRQLTNNSCCCGDVLIPKSTSFNTTAMCMKYGCDYTKEQLDNELSKYSISGCKCNHLFTSNRQEGCTTVQEFYDKRFDRKSSPFSPLFLHKI